MAGSKSKTIDHYTGIDFVPMPPCPLIEMFLKVLSLAFCFRLKIFHSRVINQNPTILDPYRGAADYDRIIKP
jgi:hypothetical protein